MKNSPNKAFVVVDAQRGFMPTSEGSRLDLPGFGELGVDNGEQIVPRINQLTREFGKYGIITATTQDWHPAETAHFSPAPNFVNTWPQHCIGETPGAELHPDLDVAGNPEIATRFIKGDVACASPEDDTSYTGALAYDPMTNILLPEWLRRNGRTDIYVAGLALGDGANNKLCVDSTAADLQEQGFNVSLIADAAEAVMPENRELCFRNLGNIGVRIVTTNQVMAEMTVQS